MLMWAAFPPLDWGWLAFLAPVPLLWALRRVERFAGAVAVGFLYGFVFFGAMLYWIFILGAVAWIPLTVVMAAVAAGYGVLVWSFRLWPAWRWWLIVVAGWALMEFLKARFPFGGFPWGTIGYASGGLPGLIGSVQWIGPLGWSVVTVAFAAGIVLFAEDRDNWRFPLDASIVVIILYLGGTLLPPSVDGAPVRVAVVQGGSPCPRTHCQNESQRIFERHLDLTRQIPRGSVDLVVWAENSTGGSYDPETNAEARRLILEEATRLPAYFLISGTRTVDADHFLNVNFVYSPEGVKLGEYVKRHPVPFGEYVPLRGLFGFIPQLEAVPRDMISGREAVVFDLPFGVLGSVISFEGAFDRSIRSIAETGSQILAVATNESTYGPDNPASDQLIDMTRVNAASVGQDLIHAAITGKSAFISADGQIVSSTELFDETVLYGTVSARTAAPTIYTRFGDWVLYLALIGMIAALAWPGAEGLNALFGRSE